VAFDDDQLTEDRFLDGQLSVVQPRDGYRAGVDPVFLAAAVSARAGQTVLELGCGVGVASMCLARRVAGLHLTGVEVQANYAELAERNAAKNKIAMEIRCANLTELPDDIRQRRFDHVIANPPYFQRAKGSAAADAGRDHALAGDTPLSDWVAVAARRLAPRGTLTMIQRADRLHHVLTAINDLLGSILVQPLAPRVGRDAELVIVQAIKGGRGAFRLAAPIVLHEGERHLLDGESYTPDIQAVLRQGAALPLAR